MNKKSFESKEEKEAYITVRPCKAVQCVGAKAAFGPRDCQTEHFGKR